jgi:hypothetical protein
MTSPAENIAEDKYPEMLHVAYEATFTEESWNLAALYYAGQNSEFSANSQLFIH